MNNIEKIRFLEVNKDVAVAFASEAHEVWRKGFDSVYAETRVPSKQRIKPNTDGTEGDINVPFENLHADWAKENLEAGKAALLANAMFKDIDAAASYIHDEWMKRNPKSDWNAAQHVPYAELPEVEKEKDRVHVRKIQELLLKKENKLSM